MLSGWAHGIGDFGTLGALGLSAPLASRGSPALWALGTRRHSWAHGGMVRFGVGVRPHWASRGLRDLGGILRVVLLWCGWGQVHRVALVLSRHLGVVAQCIPRDFGISGLGRIGASVCMSAYSRDGCLCSSWRVGALWSWRDGRCGYRGTAALLTRGLDAWAALPYWARCSCAPSWCRGPSFGSWWCRAFVPCGLRGSVRV